jgi:ubiquinone biosynthesis protein COQ9
VPFDGWTETALRNALLALGRSPDEARLLFPNGSAEMIEAYAALADLRMEQAAAADPALLAGGVPARVRALIALRLRQAAADRQAVRRAMAWLALPRNAALAARITARTVDAIWHAAGDTAADFSWYTKRGILAGVYGATLLFWLLDDSEDGAATLAFLDRRLADVGRIGKLRRAISRPAATSV